MNEEQTMKAEVTFESLKDKVHEQFLELQDLRKSYDELTKSALKLDEIIKEKQEEIDQLKAREEEHQELNGELREEIERLNNIINELEKDVENRLMSIPDDMCDDALEEIKRTTKIAVYQVVLGKLQELKGVDKE